MANGLLGIGGAALMLGAMLTAPAVAAGPSVSEVVDGLNSNDRFAVGYMQGLLDSYNTVNYYLTQLNDNNLLYCAPNGLVLTLAQADDILSRYIEQHAFEGSFPARAVVLVALKDVFPCPGAKP
jgi:hypothetical protein